MMQIPNAFNVTSTKLKWVPGFLFVLILAVFSANCSKEPAGEEHADTKTNAGNANANQRDQSATAPLHLQQTLRGDIERASLDISMARDAMKLKNWQDAVVQLQAARKEVEAALGRQPRLRDELEALKAAIDRAITAVEGRGKEAESRVEELQTRIGAIKVNTFGE